MPRPTTLHEVVADGLCSGCGGCAAVAPDKIRMRLSAEGHLEPDGIEYLDRDERSRALSICPGVVVEGAPPSAGVEKPALWGPVRSTVAAWASDPEVRHRSSSGGALSAMAAWLISSGSADAVLHVKASGGDATRSEAVLSRSVDAVLDGAGSRYQPVAPLERLGEAVASGERFALIGRPCDISAARRLAKEDAGLARRLVLSMSIFCAGTPGMAGTAALLNEMDTDAGAVDGLRFRGMGWPGRATATLTDGSVRSMSYDESWGGVLNRHLPWRCKICPDGTGELADISFGDAWHLTESGTPSFEESPGRSVVLVRTQRAADLFSAAVEGGAIATEPLPLEDLQRIQPYQAARKQVVLSRLAALTVAGRPTPRFTNLGLRAAAQRLRPGRAATAFGGSLRRLIRSGRKREV